MTKNKTTPNDALNIPQNVDVLCVGGGLIGLTMANALAQAGVSVAVIDKMPLDKQLSPIYDGRASAIAMGSVNLFKNLGIWDAIMPYANPITSIQVQEKHPVRGLSPLGLTFDKDELSQDDNTHMTLGYVVENNRLRGILADQALHHQSSGVLHYIAPARVHSIDMDTHGAIVSVMDDAKTITTIRCPLVLGCDGKFSQTRAMMDIQTTTLDYKQHAIVCTIEHQHSHNNKAIEQFMPAGPFAILPMTDNRSNIVWSCRPEHTSAYMDLSDADFKTELSNHLGDWTGDFDIIGERHSYPFSLLHAHSYTAHRFALVGDAAHGMHAIAGQGFNLGIRDVAVLADIIIDAMGTGQDIGGAMTLEAYDSWRRFDIISLEAITNGLNALFSNDNPTLRLGRGAGMALLDKTTAPKQFFMKHAMGMMGGTMGGIKGGMMGHMPKLLQDK